MGDASTTDNAQPVVYLTGFKPFIPHPTNSSEETVEKFKEKHKSALEKELDVQIVTDVIKVEYNLVSNFIPKKWQELKPKMVVHLGMSNQASTLVLEQLAHNGPYEKTDDCRCLPSNGVCIKGGDDWIESEIRMDKVSKALNETDLQLKCTKSTDPGKFLCDFIYYTSLSQDKSRVSFIHVPPTKEIPVENIAASLAVAIKEMYKQVKTRDLEKLATQVEKNSDIDNIGEEYVSEKQSSTAV